MHEFQNIMHGLVSFQSFHAKNMHAYPLARLLILVRIIHHQGLNAGNRVSAAWLAEVCAVSLPAVYKHLQALEKEELLHRGRPTARALDLLS